MLSVNPSGINNKFFIMDNSIDPLGKPVGQVPATPYFDTMKVATIAMFELCRTTNKTNLYDMSQKRYKDQCK